MGSRLAARIAVGSDKNNFWRHDQSASLSHRKAPISQFEIADKSSRQSRSVSWHLRMLVKLPFIAGARPSQMSMAS
jgi:hypothetical protein